LPEFGTICPTCQQGYHPQSSKEVPKDHLVITLCHKWLLRDSATNENASPQLANNQAPLFKQVKVACPTMSPHILAGNYVDALMGYFMDFVNWEQQIQMYFESRIIRELEYHLLFMQGLAPALLSHIKPQEGVLHVFRAKHCTLLKEPPCDIELFAFLIYERLLAIVGPLERTTSTSLARSPRVASINADLSDFN
jgi:hypothetical protein